MRFGKTSKKWGSHSILVKDALLPNIRKAEVIPIHSDQNTEYQINKKEAKIG